MKKYLLCLLGSLMFICRADAQVPGRTEPLGLMAELAYIKSSSEQKAFLLLSDTNLSSRNRALVISEYNQLRLHYDQVILQLMSDCRRMRSVKYFRKLDNALAFRSIDYIQQEEFMHEKLRVYSRALLNGAMLQRKFISLCDSLASGRAPTLANLPAEHNQEKVISQAILPPSERIALMLGEMRFREWEQLIGKSR